MINLFLNSIILGTAIALGKFAYDKITRLLWRLTDLMHEKINRRISVVVERIIDNYKQKEYINWKKFKLPNLIKLSKYNDEKGNKALAERIARSNHKNVGWFGEKIGRRKTYEF